MQTSDRGDAAFAIATALVLLVRETKLVMPSRLKAHLASAETRLRAEGKEDAADLIADFRDALDATEMAGG